MYPDAGDSQHDALLVSSSAERFGVFVQGERAGDRAGGVVGLLAQRAEQHVERIADDRFGVRWDQLATHADRWLSIESQQRLRFRFEPFGVAHLSLGLGRIVIHQNLAHAALGLGDHGVNFDRMGDPVGPGSLRALGGLAEAP
jgi:hypothetical protein